MKIVHRYILRELLKNLVFCSIGFTVLFLVFDFFDRIDNIYQERASVGTTLSYFLFKVPLMFNLTLPIAMLIATMFTFGLLARHSEITAMRASGVRILWLAKPLFAVSLTLSIFSLLLGETLIPYCARRSREIYNIDIKEKDKTGTYSQSDFWWRDKQDFYAVEMFDSRSNQLLDLSKFEINDGFKVDARLEAAEAGWVNDTFGWSMGNVKQYKFRKNGTIETSDLKSLPLPIKARPVDFYDVQTDPLAQSYFQLRKFIKNQRATGVAAIGYITDLHAKLAFPFVIFISSFIVLPFSLKPARTGSMAGSFIAGLLIGFSYYVVHSFSLAMGRAEIWPPLFAAWAGGMLMAFIGFVLNLGAESPG